MRFSTKVLTIFSSDVITTILQMALSIWIARVLGPDNLGLLVLFFAIINYSDEFGRMGIDHAAIYVWGKKEAQFSQLRRHVFLIATIQAAICIAIFIIFRKPLMSALFKQHDLSLRWYALTLANIPLAIYLIYARKLLLAKQTLWAYNATLWSAPLCQLTLLALTKLAGVALTIGWVLAANLAGQIIVVVWSYCEILKLDPTPAGPLNSHLVKNLFRRGLQMYLLNAVSFLQKRFDLIIVAYLLEPKAIAFYSLASTASQMLWKIPSSVGTLFYPVTTEMKVADAAGFASNVYRHLAFLLTIAAALAAVMIGPAVRLLYGAAYLPLVIPFQFLLTGTVSLGLARVLIDYFNATGTTLRIIWVFGLAIILNTALNFLFISRWQIAGAAAASSITHLGTITVLSCLFLKTSGLPVRSFIPTHEDWKFYKKALTGSLVRSYMKRV